MSPIGKSALQEFSPISVTTFRMVGAAAAFWLLSIFCKQEHTFNDIAFQLAGAPWVIKSYTKNHITLIQNEASPDKDKIATIELDRVD